MQVRTNHWKHCSKYARAWLQVRKLQENVDWESCQTKYSDILVAFRAQYLWHLTEKIFLHDGKAITKAQVTAKLKNIRGKYWQAADTGSQSSQGRVVLAFFELCEELWGGSTATRAMDTGFKTGDLKELSSSNACLHL